MYGNWKIVVISLNAISLLSLLFIQLYFVICIFYWGKEFSHGKELMQITEFLRLIGGLYYYSYSCITKKWITWIYAEKLHFETFFLQDEPLLLHSKLNQAQHGKSRIQTKLKEWMVEITIYVPVYYAYPVHANDIYCNTNWTYDIMKW